MTPKQNDENASSTRWLKLTRIGLIAVVLVGAIVAHQAGVLDIFAEPARLKAWLLELGPWGYVAFVLAYAVLHPFGVPGTVFILAAPLIWPWPVAFALSMAGTMAGSVVGFSFARFVARDWVAARIPQRFRRYEEMLEKRGFVSVVVLRTIFWMPPPLHFFFGVSRVGFWTHIGGSLVGYFVPLLLTAYFGAALFEWMSNAPPWVWALAAVVAITGAGVWFWLRRRRRAPDDQ